MTGLDPTNVATAGSVMARYSGLSWIQDKPEVISLLNKYRELLYTLYNEFELFNDGYYCLRVHTYRQECSTCPTGYQGITLPSDLISVEDAWSHNQPMLVRSNWREGHTGIGVTSCKRVELVEIGELYPTERDLPEASTVKIFTEREEDACKLVVVTGLDACGKKITARFKLAHDGWVVAPRKKFAKITEVSLPSDRCGFLILSDSKNNELSRYAPWEVIPGYRRFRVASQCCPASILVKGVKRFTPVYFDQDIVEIGNTLIIEAAAKYFKYGDDTTEGKDLSRAKLELEKLKIFVGGLLARHAGGAIQDGNPIYPSHNIRPKRGLPGYSKR